MDMAYCKRHWGSLTDGPSITQGAKIQIHEVDTKLAITAGKCHRRLQTNGHDIVLLHFTNPHYPINVFIHRTNIPKKAT